MTTTNSLNNKPDTARTDKSIGVYGSSGALSEIGPLSNGQMAIGNTGNNPTAAALASAGGTITVTNGAGTIDLVVASPSVDAGSSGFLAYKNSNSTNVTGDGTAYTVAYATEVFDIGADYNTGTYTFTAPDTGKYYISGATYSANMSSSHTTMQIRIVTSNRTYYPLVVKAGPNRDIPTGGFIAGGAFITDMDASDTVYVIDYVSGSTKVVTCGAARGNCFSGMRIF